MRKGIETLKSSLIAALQGPDPAFKPAQATQAQESGGTCLSILGSRQPAQFVFHRLGPRFSTFKDIDQGFGIKEGDHQLRYSDSSASISALVRPAVDGACCKSHSREEISGTGAWLARRASSMAAMPRRLSSAELKTLGRSPAIKHSAILSHQAKATHR